MSDGEYRATTTGIAVVGGVEVDITVRGNEDRAEKVLMDLNARLGRLGAAFEGETPPSEIQEVPDEYTPPMTVAWGRVFEESDDQQTD